jgi:hypothetical protein
MLAAQFAPARVLCAAGQPRRPDAAEALARLLAERQRAPFAWGVHDCCLWAADAVRAQVGVDPAAQLRGRYASALQAARVIAAAGGSLEDIARAALGQPLRHPMLACAGDVGLTMGPVSGDTADRATLAVCVGEWWALPAAHGLALQPLTAASMSWRVGCA